MLTSHTNGTRCTRATKTNLETKFCLHLTHYTSEDGTASPTPPPGAFVMSPTLSRLAARIERPGGGRRRHNRCRFLGLSCITISITIRNIHANPPIPNHNSSFMVNAGLQDAPGWLCRAHLVRRHPGCPGRHAWVAAGARPASFPLER